VRPERTKLEAAVGIGVDLVILGLMWRAFDGPDPLELVRDAYSAVRRALEPRLAWRREMMDTLEGIRDLPETEGGDRS
jgi:hypothetical protein